MNRLEDELTCLVWSISYLESLLENRKNIRYEDWCKAHEYLDDFKERRDELLNMKFKGELNNGCGKVS